jgi:hypothetical protein
MQPTSSQQGTKEETSSEGVNKHLIYVGSFWYQVGAVGSGLAKDAPLCKVIDLVTNYGTSGPPLVPENPDHFMEVGVGYAIMKVVKIPMHHPYAPTLGRTFLVQVEDLVKPVFRQFVKSSINISTMMVEERKQWIQASGFPED